MTALELFKEGKLQESIDEAISEVKKNPADAGCRLQLAELLCFAGDLERADKHLDNAGKQDPKSMVVVSLFRQLVRGEKARQEFYNEGRLPEFLEEVPDHLQLHLKASIAVREGKPSEAAELLAQAEEQRVPISGTHGEQAFDDFRDLDDLNSSFLEIITSTGKYYWVPFEKIKSLSFREPKLARDLVWRSAQIEVIGGPDGEIYVPVNYPTRPSDGDENLILGRGTDWQGSEGEPVRGIGQRMFLVGEQDHGILELTDLAFAHAAVTNE